ncbi:hypothetical protein [Pelagibius sp.]|uniref:hypothetical protein n=1 Tax=Pelagibius sp. TaxID=1931238 RepID=UPI003BAFE301
MTYNATTSDTVSTPLTVERFVGKGRTTPGNVGLCLSGGGSRALTAGMGQLRALNYLTTKKNGPSLLSQVKAVSTVSGGSWLGVSFTYLSGRTSDTDFLNAYIANPHDLVPSKGSSIGVTLDKLPRGNMGVPSTSRLFSVPVLAVEAYILWKFFGTPANMLWQVLMGFHIMSEHNLYSPGAKALPTSLFSWDKKTLKQAVVGPNPSLAKETAHLVASGAGRTSRPYILCNTAMFVKKGKTQLLAPVQATPFFTGIVGTPDAVDANGRKVGGGGVTSFAFNSALQSVSGADVTVAQARQWSLTDIVGASSAAFAGQLQQIINDPLLLLKYLKEFAAEIWKWLKSHLSSADLAKVDEARIQSFVKAPTLAEVAADTAIFDPGALIPAYDYWPVRNVKPNAKLKSTRFADGGNLENTGVASMLSYGDIDSVIACVNSATPMTKGKKGVIDPKSGKEIPKTRIIVDGQIPPLFGYQPYDPKKGYVPFGKKTAKANLFMSQSQVFPAGDFPALLKALWKNSGSGKNTCPANALQKLKTKKNDWFGVAKRDVTVLWVYTNAVETWISLLRPDVKKLVAASADFPHYGTLDTNLSAAEINLLASLTAWSVGDPSNSKDFVGLFK